MNARQLESVAVDLASSRRRIREAMLIATACSVVAVALVPFTVTLAIASATGAVSGWLVAIATVLTRREKIARLALDPVTYEVPDVARYARQVSRRLQRERLAGWIVEMLREAAGPPGHWYLSTRVGRYAEELAALGRDLADPDLEIPPASAAAAHLLLTQAVYSPLYNPTLPDDELAAIIARIRMGISRAPA